MMSTKKKPEGIYLVVSVFGVNDIFSDLKTAKEYAKAIHEQFDHYKYTFWVVWKPLDPEHWDGVHEHNKRKSDTPSYKFIGKYQRNSARNPGKPRTPSPWIPIEDEFYEKEFDNEADYHV